MVFLGLKCEGKRGRPRLKSAGRARTVLRRQVLHSRCRIGGAWGRLQRRISISPCLA